MADISSLIRRDKEFEHSVECIREQFLSRTPLPIAINGLQGGATISFLAESVREARRISGAAVLIIVKDDSKRAEIASALN